ncbi:MAG TPA: hypothetical protein PLB45_01320 [Bacilli bacterium]|jgi:hypothetical protein|nr:hypothetical protein [Bacilli bacterium]HQC83497.1 hypothetical protein [Bacilli bacterium]
MNNKNKIILVIIITLLIVLITIMLKNNKKEEPTELMDTTTSTTTTTSSSIKIDESVNYITDLTLDTGSLPDSYYNQEEDKTYYLNNLKFPYINIKTDDATSINEEIKKLADQAIQIYTLGVSGGLDRVDESTYSYYVNNNILSIVIIYSVNYNTPSDRGYYTYNFDLTTGNKVDFKKIYTSLGNSEDGINDKVNRAIKKYMDDLDNSTSYSLYNHTQGYTGEDSYTASLTKAYETYKESITNNTIKYYIDDSKNIHIITTIMVPIGEGYTIQDLKI